MLVNIENFFEKSKIPIKFNRRFWTDHRNRSRFAALDSSMSTIARISIRASAIDQEMYRIDRNEIIRNNLYCRPQWFDRRTRTVYPLSTRFAPLECPFFVVRCISSRASCARRRLETINDKMRIRGSGMLIFHIYAYVALRVVRWISSDECRRSAHRKEDKKWS
jgi:hypothetical protein